MMTRKTMEEDIDNVVRRIKTEVSSMPISSDYDLSDFRFNKVVEDISKTLLKFISILVSKGTITKKSLTLAQCIQQHLAE